jgi:trans-aconitate 2-methyltransferase
MAEWNAAQYLKFAQERTQPAIDLARRIEISHPKKVLDIGCGPGNSTQVLAHVFPKASICGVDSSSAMIEAATANCSELDFKICDAGKDLSKLDKDFDVVFSNACIQWIPNHTALLKDMMLLLRPGGQIAIQIPMNHEEPIHRIIQELANGKWKAAFPNPRIFYTLTPGQYFDLLSEVAAAFSMWETVYYHKLKSHKAIIEWYRGTGLRPYLEALPEEKKESFEKDVFERIVDEYPIQKNGDIIFRFPRFFFVATSHAAASGNTA